MINISKLAQDHFKKLLLKKKKNTNIRVFIKNFGTLKAECGVSYCFQGENSINDVEIIYSFFRIYVNQDEINYLKDTLIDIFMNGIDKQLTIKAPYLKEYFLNGNFTPLDEINNFLDIEINPKLLLHKGSVMVIKITQDGYLFLKFSGGCNGCSMIGQTLKNLIEKKIIKKFPNVKGIIDITKHSFGRHSYNYF